jgi:hypothetical protein
VLLRKILYDKAEDAPPEGSVVFPMLILDQPICLAPGAASDDSPEEYSEWALQIADSCSRAWPSSSRVRVSGFLYHQHNWHHHSRVLILAKHIARLDGQLPPCK